jgi:hypothetical protein
MGSVYGIDVAPCREEGKDGEEKQNEEIPKTEKRKGSIETLKLKYGK